jgi:hypothetical protein
MYRRLVKTLLCNPAETSSPGQMDRPSSPVTRVTGLGPAVDALSAPGAMANSHSSFSLSFKTWSRPKRVLFHGPLTHLVLLEVGWPAHKTLSAMLGPLASRGPCLDQALAGSSLSPTTTNHLPSLGPSSQSNG